MQPSSRVELEFSPSSRSAYPVVHTLSSAAKIEMMKMKSGSQSWNKLHQGVILGSNGSCRRLMNMVGE